MPTNPSAGVSPSPCACAATPANRRAVGVDPEIKARNQKRLRRIEGQVRGLQKMIMEDRYCPEVMIQIASVHEALRSVGRELMKNHLHHCVTAAVRASPAEASASYQELLDLIYTHSR